MLKALVDLFSSKILIESVEQSYILGQNSEKVRISDAFLELIPPLLRTVGNIESLLRRYIETVAIIHECVKIRAIKTISCPGLEFICVKLNVEVS